MKYTVEIKYEISLDGISGETHDVYRVITSGL